MTTWSTLDQESRALCQGHTLPVLASLPPCHTCRDLGSEFIDELEALLEAHVPFYSRALAQHAPQQWAPALRRGGLFKLVEYSSLANPLLLEGQGTLRDILNSQGWVRGALGVAGEWVGVGRFDSYGLGWGGRLSGSEWAHGPNRQLDC